MKKTSILVISSLLLLLAQPAQAKPDVAKLIKKGGRVVHVDTAIHPKKGGEVTRFWIQTKKRLWACYAKNHDDSYCLEQE